MNGYAKSRDLVSAHQLFDQKPERNSDSWTALIEGYMRFGFLIEALDLLRRMVMEGVQPD